MRTTVVRRFFAFVNVCKKESKNFEGHQEQEDEQEEENKEKMWKERKKNDNDDKHMAEDKDVMNDCHISSNYPPSFFGRPSSSQFPFRTLFRQIYVPVQVLPSPV